MDWGVLKGRGSGFVVKSAPHIPASSMSGSPVAGVVGNKLLTLGDPLLPTFIYTVCILIWS
jgi:hypothetical protein